MSGPLNLSKNGRGGTPKPSLDQAKIAGLEFSLRQQNQFIVNMSARVHQVQESVDISEYSGGAILLEGTADILAKAGLTDCIKWIPPKKEQG